VPEWIDSTSGLDLLGIAGAVTAAAAIWLGVRALARMGNKVNRFLVDWYGAPGDDNHDAEPGVLHRMSGLEAMLHQHVSDEDTILTAMGGQVTALAEQVQTRTQPLVSGYRNDGNSLTDLRVHQNAIEAKVDALTATVADHAASPSHDRRATDRKDT
jgi:hypothetical protein